MTREEAIEIIANTMFIGSSADDIDTAINMAIEALEREPSISEDGTLTVNVEDGSKVSRVLVCGDNHFGGLYYPEQETVTEFADRCRECGERYGKLLKEKTKIDWNYGEIKELTNKYHPAILNNYLEEDLCIKNLPSVRTEKTWRWIPVSEKLPKNSGRYLAYIVNKHDDKLQYIMTCYYSVDGYWHWFPDDECASDNVVAWMPLPEPYKEESEDKK